ncbi:hypothetical protein TNCV_1384901 [Trichonephila clavipes]|nr:hypothetical protein TNCV_1384901 [Trichonephila clavipes]
MAGQQDGITRNKDNTQRAADGRLTEARTEEKRARERITYDFKERAMMWQLNVVTTVRILGIWLAKRASDFRLLIWELEPGSVVEEVWPIREGPMAYEEVKSRNTIGSVSFAL